jgi:hypothetical protein
MGTFMQTGVINEFRVAKSNNKAKGFRLAAFRKAVESAVVNNPESYDCEETDGMYYWTLRQEVREAHLVDLIRRVYTDFYDPRHRNFDRYYKPILAFLATNPSYEELNAWTEETGDFSETDEWIRTIIMKGDDVPVHFSFLGLSYEGKVMAEELDQHLSFFERAIRRMYADNPLGGSLAVDIG